VLAAATTAEGSEPAPPERILGSDGGSAYRKFLAWTVGQGFDMAVLEIAAPRRVDELIRWTEAQAPGARVVHLGQLGERPLHTLLEEACPSPRENAVLLLRGAEQARDRLRLFARLNVQRDELARAFAVPWVVLIHPAAALEMLEHAPDISDFAGLWLREEVVDEVLMPSPTLPAQAHQGRETTVLGSLSTGADHALFVEAESAMTAGRYDEARDRLAQFDLHHPHALVDDLVRIQLQGRLAYLEGRPVEALAALERALSLLESANRPRHEERLRIEIADVQRALGDFRGARASLERALALVGEGAETDATAGALHALGSVLREQGDLAGARQALERALAIDAKVPGTEGHAAVASTLHELGIVLLAQGDLASARQALERALAIEAKVLGTEEHPNVAASLHVLGMVLEAQGDLAGAQRAVERSLAIDAKVLDTEHPNVAASLHELGIVLLAQGDLAGARRALERSLAIKAKSLGTEEHPDVATGLAVLAAVAVGEGRIDEAVALYRRALAIRDKCFGTRDHYMSADTEISFAAVLFQLGQIGEARELLQHGVHVLQAQAPNHPYLQQLRAALAQTPE
jgi:tetratricopeptide (TPR) repeat protein